MNKRRGVLPASLLSRLIRGRDGQWTFLDEPMSPWVLLAILEYLMERGAELLFYRHLRFSVQSASVDLRNFLSNQDFILAAETQDESQLEGYAAKMGHAHAGLVLGPNCFSIPELWYVCPIAIEVLRSDRLREVFTQAGMKRIEEDGNQPAAVFQFPKALALWKHWRAKDRKPLPPEMLSCLRRLYGSEPSASRQMEARQRIALEGKADRAEPVPVPFERLRQETETRWAVTDPQASLEEFWQVVWYVYHNDGHRLDYRRDLIFIQRLVEAYFALLRHQQLMEGIAEDDLEKWQSTTEELGGMCGRLVIRLGAAYRHFVGNLFPLEHGLAQRAPEAFARGFCEGVRDPKSAGTVGESPLGTREKTIEWFFHNSRLRTFLEELPIELVVPESAIGSGEMQH